MRWVRVDGFVAARCACDTCAVTVYRQGSMPLIALLWWLCYGTVAVEPLSMASQPPQAATIGNRTKLQVLLDPNSSLAQSVACIEHDVNAQHFRIEMNSASECHDPIFLARLSGTGLVKLQFNRLRDRTTTPFPSNTTHSRKFEESKQLQQTQHPLLTASSTDTRFRVEYIASYANKIVITGVYYLELRLLLCGGFDKNDFASQCIADPKRSQVR